MVVAKKTVCSRMIFARNNNVKVFIDDFFSQSDIFRFSRNINYNEINIFSLKNLS